MKLMNLILQGVCKAGCLLIKCGNLQRWKNHYCWLKDGLFCFRRGDQHSGCAEAVALGGCVVTEVKDRAVNNVFKVITPHRNLVLCAENRRQMEQWIGALKAASSQHCEEATLEQQDMLSGAHQWYACSHARPTYCNVCQEALSGVTSHGLSCQVCKFKVHKRCATKATNNCKWTTLASVGQNIIEEDGDIFMPHQWIEGNLPVSAKCVVCEKTCGSVLRLQDWRCLWCRATVHSQCKQVLGRKCPLGQCRVSVLPPSAISTVDSDGFWRATKPRGSSPLLVFINSKSGDNQGIKMLRRFKQLLNPGQVFDLITGGPKIGLRLFQSFESFRVLVCGGDGSIGWVLTEIDNLGLHKQCQIGVLPLGTGNDLARVLGWGSAFDDDAQLPAILERMEHAQIKMLDRWSIYSYEVSMPAAPHTPPLGEVISRYEDSVADHLSKILHSDNHNTVISSAKVLCETVKDFITKVGRESKDEHEEESISQKCNVLNQKLDALLNTLDMEAQAAQSLTLAQGPSSSPAQAAHTQEGAFDIPTITVENSDSSPNPQFPPTGDPKMAKEEPSSGNQVNTQKDAPSSGQAEKLSDNRGNHEDKTTEGNGQRSVSNETLSDKSDGPEDKSRAGKGERSLSDDKLSTDSKSTDSQENTPSTSDDERTPPRRSRRRRAPTQKVFRKREQLMSRANSLKKAIRQIIEHTEKAVDDQNGLTEQMERENQEQFGFPPPDVATERGGDVICGSEASMETFQDSQARSSKNSSENSREIKDNSIFTEPADIHNLGSEGNVDNRSLPNTVQYSVHGEVVKVETSTLEGPISVTSGECIVHREADDILPALSINIPQVCVETDTPRSSPDDNGNCRQGQSSKDSEVPVSTLEMDLLRVPSARFPTLRERSSPDDNGNCRQGQSSEDGEMDLLLVPPPRFPTLRERRPVDQSLTISTATHYEKYECEESEKVPLSPIPGSPSLLPSTPRELSVAPSEENLSMISGTGDEFYSSPVSPNTLATTMATLSLPTWPSTLATTMTSLTVPTWCQGMESENASACTTPGSLSPLPTPHSLSPTTPEAAATKRTFFDAVVPKSPKAALPTSPSHPFSRRISKLSTLHKTSSHTKREKSPAKDTSNIEFPILGVPVFQPLPGVSGLSGLAGGSLISQVLLANADALCAAASPLMEEDAHLENYDEKCCMNNYFGIGVDAKITLDFNTKREEHPEKCRSRTKNMMWYGVIGSKEIVHKTFKNLDQRVQLECDGVRIPLPNLQGLVVLNIPSYMGGINFWGGGNKAEENFIKPSVDDKILEVVAVFGSAQLGLSRVFNLYHHRIAQCRSVKITILGEEGVPVQVDGEAWTQPPGYIRIAHKNRAQMLTRDKVFEEALKAWTEKQKLEKPVCPKHHVLSEGETQILHSFVEGTETLIKSVKMTCIYHSTAEQELMPLATQASEFLERLYPAGRLAEPAIRTQVSDLVSSVRTLYNEANLFLQEKAFSCRLSSEVEEKLNSALNRMESEMKTVYEIGGLPHFHAISGQDLQHKQKEKRKFRLMSRFLKGKKDKDKDPKQSGPNVLHIHEWGPQDVALWLESIGLGDYKQEFITHDIRGQELLTLGRSDLKELGVTKLGHAKRIQQGVKDIKLKVNQSEKSTSSM